MRSIHAVLIFAALLAGPLGFAESSHDETQPIGQSIERPHLLRPLLQGIARLKNGGPECRQCFNDCVKGAAETAAPLEKGELRQRLGQCLNKTCAAQCPSASPEIERQPGSDAAQGLTPPASIDEIRAQIEGQIKKELERLKETGVLPAPAQ